MNIKITGSGSYIPAITVKNTDFDKHVFLNDDGTPFAYVNEVIIKKFKGITGIEERRYAESHLKSSDLAFSPHKSHRRFGDRSRNFRLYHPCA
jgi:3-oxoacyl-[acyl-carrier-protein] synthase-3